MQPATAARASQVLPSQAANNANNAAAASMAAAAHAQAALAMQLSGANMTAQNAVAAAALVNPQSVASTPTSTATLDYQQLLLK